MPQGKSSSRSSKADHESVSQHSSYGDSLSYTYSTYGSGSEPDYIMLEIRIKQQADDIAHLQRLNRKLNEDSELERSQGIQRLRKLESAAKAAEKRIQELSAELARSREVVKHFQALQEQQENEIQEFYANKEAQDDRKRIEARIQQLEAEIAHGKEEIKNANYESTQQRAAIRKAAEEKCISQRLLEASEKERRDLEKKLFELERLNERQEKALEGAAQSWLKKNQQMDVLCEDLRWRMVDSKSGAALGGGHKKREAKSAATGKSAKSGATSAAAPTSNAAQAKVDKRPKTTSSHSSTPTPAAAAATEVAKNKKTIAASNDSSSNLHKNNSSKAAKDIAKK